MEKQTIKVVWPDNYELDYPSETIEGVWQQLCATAFLDPEDIDPIYFELENGVKIKYNPYILHQCYDVGRLTHHELMEMLQIREKQPKLKSIMRKSGPIAR